MRIPRGWTLLREVAGKAVFYRMECHREIFTIYYYVGLSMFCVKDDDSQITWDAAAMERDTK